MGSVGVSSTGCGEARSTDGDEGLTGVRVCARACLEHARVPARRSPVHQPVSDPLALIHIRYFNNIGPHSVDSGQTRKLGFTAQQKGRPSLAHVANSDRRSCHHFPSLASGAAVVQEQCIFTHPSLPMFLSLPLFST